MVFQICDSAPSCYRELKIIDEPPQLGMGSLERERVIPNSSVCFPSAASSSLGSIGSEQSIIRDLQPAPSTRPVLPHALDRSEPCPRLADTCNHDLLTRERLIEQRGELRLRFGYVDLHGHASTSVV